MLYSLVTFAPVTHADAVRAALASSGAGAQGAYDSCSFSCTGFGRFRPLPGANPFLGREGDLETVEEERIETDVSGANLSRVLAALRAAHPYEEPAIHVIALADPAIAAAEVDGEVAALRARLGLLEKLMRETLAGIVKDMRAWQVSNRKTLLDAVKAAKGHDAAATGGGMDELTGTGARAGTSATVDVVTDDTAVVSSAPIAQTVLPSRYTVPSSRGGGVGPQAARRGVPARGGSVRGGARVSGRGGGVSVVAGGAGGARASDAAGIAELTARCASCEDAIVALSEAFAKSRNETTDVASASMVYSASPASSSAPSAPRVSFVEPHQLPPHHSPRAEHHMVADSNGQASRLASVEATLQSICEALQEHTELLEEHSEALSSHAVTEALFEHTHTLEEHAAMLEALTAKPSAGFGGNGETGDVLSAAASEVAAHPQVTEWDYS